MSRGIDVVLSCILYPGQARLDSVIPTRRRGASRILINPKSFASEGELSRERETVLQPDGNACCLFSWTAKKRHTTPANPLSEALSCAITCHFHGNLALVRLGNNFGASSS